MTAAEVVEQIESAALALRAVDYATISLVSEPLGLVEEVAALWGRPPTRHEYADAQGTYVLVVASTQLGGVHVSVASARVATQGSV